MGFKRMKRANRNLKSNRYKRKDKYYYREQFKVVLIGIIVVMFIIFLKRLDNTPTNDTIKLVDKKTENEFKLHNVKKLFGFINGIEDYEDYAVPVFKTETFNYDFDNYISPVSGTVFKKFGNIKKSNTENEFNYGIDILVNDEEVLNIKSGFVVEVGEKDNYGKFVKVEQEEFTSYYYGLDNIFVEEGDYIYTGQQVGNFNNFETKIKKFHLEIWEQNKPINPLDKVMITSNRYITNQ